MSPSIMKSLTTFLVLLSTSADLIPGNLNSKFFFAKDLNPKTLYFLRIPSYLFTSPDADFKIFFFLHLGI